MSVCPHLGWGGGVPQAGLDGKIPPSSLGWGVLWPGPNGGLAPSSLGWQGTPMKSWTGHTLTRSRQGVPRGTSSQGSGTPLQGWRGTPPAGGNSPGKGVPPAGGPPSTGQQMEYLICLSWYASCIHVSFKNKIDPINSYPWRICLVLNFCFYTLNE